jgi:hypothetical protein
MAENVASYQGGTFHERIQDGRNLNVLAAEMAVIAFYGPINRGHSLDESLLFALTIAAYNRSVIEQIATNPDFDFSQTAPEAKWHELLDTVEAGKNLTDRPGRIRQWVARTVLAEEIQIGSRVIDLTRQARKRLDEREKA